MKRNTERWFGHIERMESEEFVKKVYVSMGPYSGGRPLGRWRDRVKERCCWRGRAGPSQEGMFGQEEIKAFLPWPPP